MAAIAVQLDQNRSNSGSVNTSLIVSIQNMNRLFPRELAAADRTLLSNGGFRNAMRRRDEHDGLPALIVFVLAVCRCHLRPYAEASSFLRYLWNLHCCPKDNDPRICFPNAAKGFIDGEVSTGTIVPVLIHTLFARVPIHFVFGIGGPFEQTMQKM